MAKHPEISGNESSWATTEAQCSDPHYFARKAAAGERKRQQIIDEVSCAAGPNDDVDWLTKRELYRAGLISTSELHATGSPELLPAGWYEHYVEARLIWST